MSEGHEQQDDRAPMPTHSSQVQGPAEDFDLPMNFDDLPGGSLPLTDALMGSLHIEDLSGFRADLPVLTLDDGDEAVAQEASETDLGAAEVGGSHAGSRATLALPSHDSPVPTSSSSAVASQVRML